MPIENYRTIKAHDSVPVGQDSTPAPKVNRLDTPEATQRLIKIEDWWYQARQAQALSRYEMALDQDFYDGLQWRDEDKLSLLERGQLPLVFNRIKPSLDWIIGTEKRTRVDSKVFPRGEEDVPLAEVKTELLKFVSDVNKAGFHRSAAFRDAAIAGVGWLEDAIRNDPTEEPLYSRYESWRNIWYDHLSVERDLSDARYIFRSKWMDLDLAIAMFPERREALRASAWTHDLWGNDDDEYYWLNNRMSADGRIISRQSYFDDAFNSDNRRERVRLVECWYREPAQVQIMRGFPRFEGTIFDEQDTVHAAVVEMGLASLYDALRLVVRCAMFTSGVSSDHGTLLQDIVSPYRHNRFPFTPIWCYRRGRDNAPYGVVRNLRDPQEDLNKRRSKGLFILSTNKMIADANAFDDWDEAAEELARPDGILKKRVGSQVDIINETDIAERHVMMEEADARYIQDVSGVTDENMGRQTNAVSGIAIQSRQNQGSLVTAEPFDNLRLAIQLQGELQLSLVEQFYDEPKRMRITDTRGQTKFMSINQPQVNPETGEEEGVLNDITESQADFIVDEQDFRESVRLAMFETLMNLCGQLPPEITINILDLVVELSDVPGKDEIVKRIRKINGQVDPDHQDDPRVQAELQVKQQQEAQQADLEQRAIEGTLAEQEAKIRKLLADVQLILEKAKTEEVNREASAMNTIMSHQEQQNVERDRRFQRTKETIGELTAKGQEKPKK